MQAKAAQTIHGIESERTRGAAIKIIVKYINQLEILLSLIYLVLSLVLDQSKQNQFIDRENHCKAVVQYKRLRNPSIYQIESHAIMSIKGIVLKFS